MHEANKERIKFVLLKTRREIQQLLKCVKLTKLDDDRSRDVISTRHLRNLFLAISIAKKNENIDSQHSQEFKVLETSKQTKNAITTLDF